MIFAGFFWSVAVSTMDKLHFLVLTAVMMLFCVRNATVLAAGRGCYGHLEPASANTQYDTRRTQRRLRQQVRSSAEQFYTKQFYANESCITRSSAIAEGPRDASCQLKSCQLPRNSAETTSTTSPGSDVANWPVWQNRAVDRAWRSVR